MSFDFFVLFDYNSGMNETKINKITKIIFGVVISFFVLLIIFLAIDFLLLGRASDLFSKEENRSNDNESITLLVAQEFTSKSPLNFEFHNRMVMNNVFDALVKLDPDMNIKPSLAISYGKIDDLTWNFRLRDGVKFQNGNSLTADDVISSYNKAISDKNSQLSSILVNISDVSFSKDKIVMKTHRPDPNFLRKIASVYIFSESEGSYYGTAPYTLSEFTPTMITLNKNSNYWGVEPKYSSVIFSYIKDKNDRISAFMNGNMNILRDVPVSLIDKLKDYPLLKQPSLEVTFLGFGESVRGDSDISSFIKNLIYEKDFVPFFGPSVKKAESFVSKGVGGYYKNGKVQLKPDVTILPEKEYILHFEVGLTELAKQISFTLEEAGLKLQLKPYSGVDFVNALKLGGLDLYLLGWKSEFGDAVDFYRNIVHSKENGYGVFNAGNYSNVEVDALIEKLDYTFDEEKRQIMLKFVMQQLVENNDFGIPLLESQVVYAVPEILDFLPRLDGYFNASELK